MQIQSTCFSSFSLIADRSWLNEGIILKYSILMLCEYLPSVLYSDHSFYNTLYSTEAASTVLPLERDKCLMHSELDFTTCPRSIWEVGCLSWQRTNYWRLTVAVKEVSVMLGSHIILQVTIQNVQTLYLKVWVSLLNVHCCFNGVSPH